MLYNSLSNLSLIEPNTARQFETSIKSENVRPEIKFNVKDIQLPALQTYTSRIHYLNEEEMKSSKSEVIQVLSVLDGLY